MVKGRTYNPNFASALAQAACGVCNQGGLLRANSKPAPSLARPNLFSGD